MKDAIRQNSGKDAIKQNSGKDAIKQNSGKDAIKQNSGKKDSANAMHSAKDAIKQEGGKNANAIKNASKQDSEAAVKNGAKQDSANAIKQGSANASQKDGTNAIQKDSANASQNEKDSAKNAAAVKNATKDSGKKDGKDAGKEEIVHILMIEDDMELAEIIAEYLEQFEMKVDIAHEPYIGLSKLALKEYQLIILDLTLPGLDGLEVCEEIRKNYDTPIIISSARSDITDKVNALELGADDYLPKPYNPKELQARIKSHLRRINTTKKALAESVKDLVYDQFKHIITMKGEEVVLTNAEFDILSYLIKKEGGVVSREELVYNCTSISEDSSNKSIDVIISRIRQKMGDDPKEPRYIHSIRGIGYKLTQ